MLLVATSTKSPTVGCKPQPLARTDKEQLDTATE